MEHRRHFLAGFFDTATAANQVDGAYFLYDDGGVSAGSAASANWQMVTSNNSTRTFSTTSTAISAGAWVRLRIVVNAAASSVEFFIDDVSAGTITTNIPSGTGRQLGFGNLLIKSVGTAQRTANYDFIYVDGEFTTAR